MYKLMNASTMIIRLDDGAFIPPDPANTDYRNYLEWVAAGNTAQPADVVSNVPLQVTMRQARLALLQSNLLSQVDTAIASLPSPQKEAAQIEWEYSSDVIRTSSFVNSLGTALNLTSDQIDQLFITAATL